MWVRMPVSELERLYRENYGRFVRVASAITREPETAAEAVQEAFARAIKRRGQFRGEAPLEAWIWRVVLNEAKRLAAAPAASAGLPAGEQGANGSLGGDAAVRSLIAALPERQRLAVFLRYYADLDYRTIAGALGVEVGTVSATLSSAHAALRRALREVPR